MNNITPKNIGNHQFTTSDRLLLDTNIWLYIYGPQAPNDITVVRYSDAFKKILQAGCQIYIDILIVSEFINSYARLKYNQEAPSVQFKKYRKSPLFKTTATIIAAAINRVLKHCSRVESGFSVLTIDDLVNEYGKGNSDINDQVLVELCKKENFTLITHDADFQGKNIPILTANNRLFKK